MHVAKFIANTNTKKPIKDRKPIKDSLYPTFENCYSQKCPILWQIRKAYIEYKYQNVH